MKLSDKLLARLQSRWTYFRREVLRYETRSEMRVRLQFVAAGLRYQIEQHRDHIELLSAERDALRVFVQKQKARIEELDAETVEAYAALLCKECGGRGWHEYDGRQRTCTVCDGEGRLSFQMVKEYAQQIDALLSDKAKRERTAANLPFCVKCSGPIKRGQRFDVVSIRHLQCSASPASTTCDGEAND